MKKVIYINDSIHGLISLSEYEGRIISSIGFNRLHDVYQNSTVYLTFPTNRTKRFEHSIGTMKLCSDIFYYSILNSDGKIIEKFYKTFDGQIKKIIKEIARDTNICEQKLGGVSPVEVPNIVLDKLRNSITPSNVPTEYKIIHIILMESVRAAALLHDIGHPPFSHIVEFALKASYDKYKDMEIEDNERLKDFIQTMTPYFEDSKKLHEKMGEEISDSILKEIIATIDDEDERYDENLFEVIVLKCVNKIFRNEKYFCYLHEIIDSSLDGDRLDYVTRDMVNSGLTSGKIDYKRIINDMQIRIDKEEIHFCIPLKAVNSVEDFAKRRYNIYKDIVYHHRVIKTDYLLEYIVRSIVDKYLMDDNKQENNSPKMVIPFDISGLWFPLGNAPAIQKSNALSQWNDSWLMTILRQIYYTDYYRNNSIKKNSAEYILSQQLSELLRNKKCYYSLIKRSENFKIIDDAVKQKIYENSSKICDLKKTLTEKIGESSKEGGAVDKQGTWDFISNLIDDKSEFPKGFAISYIYKHRHAVKIEHFEESIKKVVNEETKQILGTSQIGLPVIVFKSISSGLDKPIYFYDLYGKILTIDDISGISDILSLESDYFPVFYIYILIQKGDDIVKEKREMILNKIGDSLGDMIANHIITFLENEINDMEEKLCL